MTLLIGLCFVFGLVFGSFANVCVHRIPRGESLLHPPSRCPACGEPVGWRRNVPVLSWLWLRGRCGECSAPISWRYPLLELLMGVSWAYLAWHFGPTPQLLMALALFFWLWILTFIDLETGLLPDVLTFSGMALGLAFSFWIGDWRASLIGMAAGYGVFWLVARLFLLATGREGMGYGDFKLLAMLGAFLGWQALPFIVFVSSLVGAVVGGLYLILARKDARAEIPFGPYLALAGMVWMLWGDEILGWYLRVMGR
ncbi:MAG: prepilin peptidase [Mariprofundaceae bacterium]